MTTNLIKNNSENFSGLNYSVLVEEKEGGYQASVWGMSDLVVFAPTREEALKSLHEVVNARLQNVEIVTAVIEQPKTEHPLMKFAGMYQNNPLFNEVLEQIENYRRELDAEINTGDDA